MLRLFPCCLPKLGGYRELLERSLSIWVCVPGAWDSHSPGEFTSYCKISSSFRALQHRFSSCKGSSSAEKLCPCCSEINRVSRGKGKTKVHK